MPVFLLFFGAAAVSGALLRWGASNLLGAPWSTFAVNILGSFLMGYLFFNFKDNHDAVWRLPLLVGFLGAFTTYSSFSLECLQFLQAEDYRGFVSYLFLMNTLCILGCWGGCLLYTSPSPRD